MANQYTEKMIFARAGWITELTHIPLEIDLSGQLWTIYAVERGTGKLLQELCTGDSKYSIFQSLRAMYELATIMQRERKEASKK